MTMKTIAAFNSLHRGQVLATSVPSSGTEYLAWIGVYPLDVTRETTRAMLKNQGQAIPLPGTRAYRIRRFEVDRTLIEQDASIAEPELEKKTQYFAFGDDDLVEILLQLGARVEQLELPYRSNYPI